MSLKALILVGGDTRGTRFRPLSLDVPKVLFPVAGRPLISHALSALTEVPTIKEVLLIGFYDESVFKDFIREASKEFPQFTIKYLREYEALGTAGGLYHFRDVIMKNNPERFFVIHADVCCSFPLKNMLEYSKEKDARYVILGTRVPRNVASNFGCIVQDNETHKVLHYVEKPEETVISNLINAGVYLFDKSIFDIIREAREEQSEIDVFAGDNEQVDVLRLEQDVLVRLPQTGRFYVYETRDFWRQIKTAGSAVPANSLYLQKIYQNDSNTLGFAKPSGNIIPPVFIDPSAQVDKSAKLGPDVSIGPNCKIGAGVRIKETIVLDNTEIKPNACILYSILSRQCKIGSWSRVEGTPVSPSEHSQTIVKNGVRVQSVTILASNVIVGDEVRVQNCVVLPHKEIKSDVANEVIM